MGKRGNYSKGIYIVENNEKYFGKSNPKYRSSWESKFCYFLDHCNNVTKWAFESIIIPYVNEIDGKTHKYITDFCFEEVDKNGKVRKFIVEIKPEKQTKPPKPPKNQNKKAQKRFLYEAQTYIKNICKWRAVHSYCLKKGLEFRIVSLLVVNGNAQWDVVSLDQILNLK